MRTDPRRLLGMLLLLVAAPALALFAQDPPAPETPDAAPLLEAKLVIEKMITAGGGREAMQAVHSRVVTGELEIMGQGMTAKIHQWLSGEGRFRETMDMQPLGAFENGFTGDVAWSVDPIQGARLLDGVEKALAKRSSHLNPLLHIGTDYKTTETVGRDQVNDMSCLKMEMTTPDGMVETWFVDEETWRRVRTEVVIEAPMLGKIKAKFDESDFRAVDGIVLPHRILIDQGIQKVTLRTESIEHNVEIDEGKFAIPGEVQMLIDKAAAKKEAEKAEAEKVKEGAEPVGTGG